MKMDPAPEVSKVIVEVEAPATAEKLKALVAPRAESTAMVRPEQREVKDQRAK